MKKENLGFINLQKLDPSIIVELCYATTNNFTQQIIYDFQTAIARVGTTKKLAKASQALWQKGYRIKVWDAFRPVTAQKNYSKFILIQLLLPHLTQTSVTKKESRSI